MSEEEAKNNSSKRESLNPDRDLVGENRSGKNKDEHYRLGGQPPLVTILKLATGPIMAQLASAFSGMIDTIWVNKACGETGVSAVSVYTAFDNIGKSFGFLTSVAGSSKISALFGSGRADEASQVVCDLIRLCIVSGILVPAVLSPLIKIGVRWFGTPEETVQEGFLYMFPILLCTTFTCWFVTCGGFLQAEGRSFNFAIIQLCSLIVNMFVFDPLFLLGIKMGVLGAALARILSEAIPAIIIIILYFCGKFSVKPKFSQLFRKFSPETWAAVRVGLSQLIANLSIAIPGILARKFVGQAATDGGYNFSSVLSAYNTLFRYNQLGNSIMIGINNGYLPAASYSRASKNYRRWLRLSIHINWINFLAGSILAILTIAIPRQISRIFGSEEEYLYWGAKFLTAGNSLGFLLFARFNVPSMLQSLQMGLTSVVLSLLTQLVSITIFMLILYYTGRNKPDRVVWAYGLSYLFGLILGSIVIFFPVKRMIMEMRKKVSDETQSLDNLD